MKDKSAEDERVKAPGGQQQSKEDHELDEALYDTFPASDPVSGIQQVEPTSPPRGEEIHRKENADKGKRE
jgi:hypothetical protein